MKYFIFICVFCLFNAITAVIQERKIEKMESIIEALRHEIQVTQAYMEHIDEKVNDRQS